jgi:transcription termination/antitermination protein NusA
VPEIQSGAVEIKSIAREAGSRTKIAVSATQAGIDPVGSCVGGRGARVQAVLAELHNEKIDIALWDEDPIVFITNALSPAKVEQVQLFPDAKKALVSVPEDQLSLAIGRAGQNVRLASRLSGWSIDIAQTGQEDDKLKEIQAMLQERIDNAKESANSEESVAEEKPKRKRTKKQTEDESLEPSETNEEVAEGPESEIAVDEVPVEASTPEEAIETAVTEEMDEPQPTA